MSKTPVELWVEALRSGEYKQGFHALHNVKSETWCCLGVACDVFRKQGGKFCSHINPYSPDLESFGDPSSIAGMPYEVQEWLGLRDGLGEFRVGDSTRLLAWENDGGTPFSEIADLIESRPPGLFVEQPPASEDNA